MLSRSNDVELDFDFEKVTDKSKDNTVFYFLMKLGADQLIANGSSNIITTSYPGDHGGAAADSMINSVNWFNTMKQ